MRGKIAAVKVKFPHRGNWPLRQHSAFPRRRFIKARWITMAMCGDDDAARNGRLVSQRNGGNSECLHRIRANGRCRGGTERQALCRGLAL